MKKKEQTDVQKLLNEAKAAEHKEAYRLMHKNNIFRVGIGARADSPSKLPFFVEVNIRLCPETGEVDLPLLEKTQKCLKILQSRGYLFSNQDDNYVSCEKVEDKKKLIEECLAVISLVKDSLA